MKHKWVWFVHFIVVPYVLFRCWEDLHAPEEKREIFELRRVWVPMDCLLTLSIIGYLIGHLLYERYSEKQEDKLEKE